MNNTTRTIRSEAITIDMRVLTIMEDGRKNGEIYLAAIAPDMELTVITLDEAPDIPPCFDEDDACVNIPNSTLMLCYNPAQVLELGGKHYLTGPVILMRIKINNCIESLERRMPKPIPLKRKRRHPSPNRLVAAKSRRMPPHS